MNICRKGAVTIFNNEKICKKSILTERIPIGDNEIFPTVALSSSTLADIGAEPLLRGLISTWIFLSGLSFSESESELE